MQSLEDLYTFYIQTRPSLGKLQNASRFLIHICKSMDVVSAEKITTEMYADIPPAIERFHQGAQHRAIQDKSVLAEMIGRYGPRDGWEVPLDILLNDPDENLRQFTLQALGFTICKETEHIIPFLERSKDSGNPLLRQVTIQLINRGLCSGQCEGLKKAVARWAQEGDLQFAKQLSDHLKLLNQSGTTCPEVLEWIENLLK